MTDREKVAYYEKELTKLINDDRVPLLVGYWISEIIEGKEHEDKSIKK